MVGCNDEIRRGRRVTRRGLLRTAIAVATLGLVIRPLTTAAVDPPVTPSDARNRAGRAASLRDQLRVGLKAKTEEDVAFIDRVVLLVDEGRLPRKLVDSTFLWARNRYKNRPGSYRLRPIVYFRPALVLRAKKIDVAI